MATDTFFDLHKTSFYLAEAIMGVDGDSFSLSEDLVDQCLIRNRQNKCLILVDEKKFRARDLSFEEQCNPGCMFTVQFYRNSSAHGKAVMLYVIKDGNKMVACCNENDEIVPEKMDIPLMIGEDAHRAVFYREKVSTSKYKLQSSLYPSKLLGFKRDEDNHTLSKLVLVQNDGMNESCEVHFTEYC